MILISCSISSISSFSSSMVAWPLCINLYPYKRFFESGVNTDVRLSQSLITVSDFNSEDLANCEGLFNYSDKIVKYDNINSETRMCLAYQKSKITKAKKESIKADKKSDICTYEGLVFRTDEDSKECTYKKIKREVILLKHSICYF